MTAPPEHHEQQCIRGSGEVRVSAAPRRRQLDLKAVVQSENEPLMTAQSDLYPRAHVGVVRRPHP